MPLNLRDEIIVVLDNQGVPCVVANIEIKNKTVKGDELLKLIDSLNLLCN